MKTRYRPLRRWRKYRFAIAVALVILIAGSGVWGETPVIYSDKPYPVDFEPQPAAYVRVLVSAANSGNEACIDELEVYGRDGARNLALEKDGAKASASSCLPGYAQHAVAHLNDGRYGNDYSWIPATSGPEWAQIAFSEPCEVARVVISRDRSRSFGDRVPTVFEVQLSLDGQTWRRVRKIETTAGEVTLRASRAGAAPAFPAPPPAPAVITGEAALAAAPSSLDVARANKEGFVNLALGGGAEANASSLLEGYEQHRIPHLNDGLAGNEHSWISDGEPSWAEVDLGAAYWIYEVALGNDSSGQYSDRAATGFRILTAVDYAPDSDAPSWNAVYTHDSGKAVHGRTVFRFAPVRARWVRIALDKGENGNARIDEIEIYGRETAITLAEIGPIEAQPEKPEGPQSRPGGVDDDALRYAFLGEEHAWLKAYGRADLNPNLVPYNGRVKEYPHHAGDDQLPLPVMPCPPTIDGSLNDECWRWASRGEARVAYPYDWEAGPLVTHAVRAGICANSLYLAFEMDRVLSAHLAVVSTLDWQAAGILALSDDGTLAFNLYKEDGNRAVLAQTIAIEAAHDADYAVFEAAIPLELLPGLRDAGLRVGLGLRGKHTSAQGRPVHFLSAPLAIAQEGPCIDGVFKVRAAAHGAEGPVALRGNLNAEGETILQPGESREFTLAATGGPLGPECAVSLNDGLNTYELHLFRYEPLRRTLELMREMTSRLAKEGLDVSRERAALADFETQRSLMAGQAPDRALERETFFAARVVKRELFLRDPDIAGAERVLFVKRQPYMPSHNYSVLLDAPFRGGGGVCVLDVPRRDGRLAPENAAVTTLFDSGEGISRDPMADFALNKIYFAYRPSEDGYFHVIGMNPDGSGLKQLTDGPFHDFWPCPLPDGDLAMISTRCKMRYLCWRPQAFVLFRMRPDGSDIQPLSFANLSEWAPSVMNDGRIVWTRSEYQDKGADFGHTLWGIRPDGSNPELIFGNDIIQPNGYANGREVPGTNEFVCTLISHFGDLNGPIALVDTDKGRFNEKAITTLTPEVPRPGMWPPEECFRDPVPLSHDYFLCSHAPRDSFQLFIIDRYGNREVLYADEAISSMCPTILKPRPTPPVLANVSETKEGTGEFVLQDVYAGISPPVERGQVKYIRVVEEVRSNLRQLPDGAYQNDHVEFMDWYATPTHKVSGPYGWPTYVAKAPHGIVPVEADGSAHFKAPAGRTLYFQALDEDLNELQRMRSVVQLQPGERRSCIGCHESRQQAPRNGARMKARGPVELEVAEWDGKPFSYEEVVQPVLNAKCVRCHDAGRKDGLDLRGELDGDKVPRSFRTLIERGLVHYADMRWNDGGCEKAGPLSLGTLKSRLWEVLNKGHHHVELTRDEMHRIKAWIDLNCPLWPDYINRDERPAEREHMARTE